jgi:hypothetical protein
MLGCSVGKEKRGSKRLGRRGDRVQGRGVRVLILRTFFSPLFSKLIWYLKTKPNKAKPFLKL